MIHTAQQAIQAAEAYLRKLNVKYTTIEMPKAEPGFKLDKTGELTDIWVVPYTYMVFQEEAAYIHLSDKDLSLIYILTKHGRITV